MRNRRVMTPPQATVHRALGPIDGARLSGGCDACNAFQTFAPISPGVWTVTVHHDRACPVLAARGKR